MLDLIWETIQARYPVLYKLDDADWKTWCLHALLCIASGQIAHFAIDITPELGMRLAVLWYFGREIKNRLEFKPLRFDYRYKPFDGVMDFMVPLAVVETLIRAQ